LTNSLKPKLWLGWPHCLYLADASATHPAVYNSFLCPPWNTFLLALMTFVFMYSKLNEHISSAGASSSADSNNLLL